MFSLLFSFSQKNLQNKNMFMLCRYITEMHIHFVKCIRKSITTETCFHCENKSDKKIEQQKNVFIV